MKKLTIVLIILIAIPIGVIGFGKITETCRMRKTVTEFMVVKKQYTPTYTTTNMVMSGKTLIPIVQVHPETWAIMCRGVDIKGNVRTFNFYVDEEKYNSIKVGSVKLKENFETQEE